MSDKIKDDWMNPIRGGAVSSVRLPPKEFIIQRMKAPPICSWLGSPPRPTWEMWAEFDSAAERDSELARLRKTTAWQLRPARQTVIGGNVLDSSVEDEEADLLARLALLQSLKTNPSR